RKLRANGRRIEMLEHVESDNRVETLLGQAARALEVARDEREAGFLGGRDRRRRRLGADHPCALVPRPAEKAAIPEADFQYVESGGVAAQLRRVITALFRGPAEGFGPSLPLVVIMIDRGRIGGT